MTDRKDDQNAQRPDDRRSSGSAPLPPGADPAIATKAEPLDSREPDSEEFAGLAPGKRRDPDRGED